MNKYRVGEARRLLIDQNHNHFSLESISEVAGFGSLGTFIRVLKKSEGITPGRYREKNRAR